MIQEPGGGTASTASSRKPSSPNPKGKPCVNHIDGDKANNLVSNLEWVTYSENHKHAYRTGLRVGAQVRGGDHGNAKLTWPKVRKIRALRGKLSQRKLASKFDVCKATIQFIHAGKTWVE